MMKIKKAGKPGIMVYPNIQEAEAGGPWVWGQRGLHVQIYLKKSKNNNKKIKNNKRKGKLA
jgi:hypothetical protein